MAFDFGVDNISSSPALSYYCHPPYDCRVTGTINGSGVVFIESINPVMSASGLESKQWMALVHTNKNLGIYRRWQEDGEIIYQDEKKNAPLYEEMQRENNFYGFYYIGNKGTKAAHLHIEAGYGTAPTCKWESDVKRPDNCDDPEVPEDVYYFAKTAYIEKLLFLHGGAAVYETSRYTFINTRGTEIKGINKDGGDMITGGDVGGGSDSSGGGEDLSGAYNAALARRDSARSRLDSANARVGTVEADINGKLNTLERESIQTLNTMGDTVKGWADRLDGKIDSMDARIKQAEKALT